MARRQSQARQNQSQRGATGVQRPECVGRPAAGIGRRSECWWGDAGTVAREAAIRVRIVVEAEAEAEIVSGTAAFPVAEDPAAPVDSAAPEGTAAVARGAAVRAAHPAWEAPAEAAGGGGES